MMTMFGWRILLCQTILKALLFKLILVVPLIFKSYLALNYFSNFLLDTEYSNSKRQENILAFLISDSIRAANGELSGYHVSLHYYFDSLEICSHVFTIFISTFHGLTNVRKSR